MSQDDDRDDDAGEAGEAGNTDRPARRSAKRWKQALQEARTTFDPYMVRCDRADALFGDLSRLTSANREDRELQLFWANLEVLKPSIYARKPQPVVATRHADRRELVRVATDALERALITDFDQDGFHETLILARDDLAIGSRGALWVIVEDRDGADAPSAIHVDREDFLHGAGRHWKEVPWVARRAWLTREEWRERFGEPPETIAFEKRDLGGEEATGDKKAAVHEIWCKASRRVYWVSEDAEDVIDEKDPWLDLTGFFPCPRPAYGTLTRRTLIPIPDLVYYKDQLEEINEITARMSGLMHALQLRGFYPSGEGNLAAAIEAALKVSDTRAVLLPVESFAALGGQALRDAIVWLPVDMVASVIVELRGMRNALIEDVYQITGISDIMRGSTDPNETLGAQRLKSQYGSVRVRDRQAEMVRLIRDTTRIKAEILAEATPIETLLEMAQIDDIPQQAQIDAQIQQVQGQAQAQLQQIAGMVPQLGPPGAQPNGMQGPAPGAPGPQGPQQGPQPDPAAIAQKIEQAAAQQVQKLSQTVTVEKVAALLRSQRARGFAIDIETDSTIEPDQLAEKQTRVEFAGMVGQFMAQAMQAVQAMPQTGPFLAEVLRFVASGFKVSRSLDEAIDELATALSNMPPQQPKDGGKDTAAQERAKADQVRAQADMEKSRAEIQLKQAELRDAQQKTMAEIAKIEAETRRVAEDARRIGLQTQQLAATGGRYAG